MVPTSTLSTGARHFTGKECFLRAAILLPAPAHCTCKRDGVHGLYVICQAASRSMSAASFADPEKKFYLFFLKCALQDLLQLQRTHHFQCTAQNFAASTQRMAMVVALLHSTVHSTVPSWFANCACMCYNLTARTVHFQSACWPIGRVPAQVCA